MNLILRNLFFLVLITPAFVSAQTNDFYDDAETIQLPVSSIRIEGEIAEALTPDLSKLPLHSVIVKETLLSGNGDAFTGAYRYDGYSLYDLLNTVVLKKKNEAEFPPIIDLYIEVENNKGEKVIISWGELYYPIHRHEILIATRVARIVPSKTKELWPLPIQSKLIVASDLLTHRNISDPVRITIKSYQGKFTINKGMKPMISDKMNIMEGERNLAEYSEMPAQTMVTFPAVFYGRGTGIHGTSPFKGIFVKEMVSRLFETSEENLRTGIFVMTGKDGYHAVFTFSEVMNRNDQAELLMVSAPEGEDGGRFKLFPAMDFFSDRAIKSLESIRFDQLR